MIFMTKTAYKFNYEGKTKLFLYEEETSTLYYVTKTSEQEIEDNAEWLAKFKKPLWEIINGYTVIDTIGLNKANWKNKEVRDEYLYEYCVGIDLMLGLK